MFFYKQVQNNELISLQSYSIHLDNIPDGFEEISEEEYKTIEEELESRRVPYPKHSSDDASAEQETEIDTSDNA